MRFTILARVVVAAASVTLVAAATLEQRERDDSGLPKIGEPFFVLRVSTRAVVSPVP